MTILAYYAQALQTFIKVKDPMNTLGSLYE